VCAGCGASTEAKPHGAPISPPPSAPADVVHAFGDKKATITSLPPYTKLDLQIQQRFLELPTGSSCQAEYVWIGGNNELRCKTRTLEKAPSSVAELPMWNFDGSSTEQAPGSDSEVMLKPCAFYKDPFRPTGNNILVVCSCYLPDPDAPDGLGGPIPTNTRAYANDIMEKVAAKEPWFGIEQEYTLFEPDRVTPYGWPKGGQPDRPQGPYYCSVGTENAYGRAVCEAHYKACLYAGIKISGINGEVMPGQWEYQVGPCTGIEAGDQLIMSRYLMMRICEQFGVVVSWDPKPIPGDWNGAGCHTNVSTNEMRAPGGYDVIVKAMERLGAPGKQDEHIKAYDISGGEDNKRRLTGAHETAPITKFSWGVANRGCSVRIPRMTEKEKCGYFEDRRPASNMDPYIVTGKIMETCVLPDCQ
jgi:glutamine synthetase